MSESDLVKACCDLIEMMGGVPLRVNSGMRVIPGENGEKSRVFRGAPAGTSDILALYRGQYFAIECKVGSNKPTAPQTEFLMRVAEQGGIGVVVRSLDFLQSILETTTRATWPEGAIFDDPCEKESRKGRQKASG